jgi:HEAT repeats
MAGRSGTAASLTGRALCLLLMAGSGVALADGRLQFLVERLRYPPAAKQPDDFRVRTNAALALGATNDDGAIVPLCVALDDPNELVRQAVALSLKRLARDASLDCLRKRFAVEPNAAVKANIGRAIESAQAAAGGAPGVSSAAPGTAQFVANAKYYVSISQVVNNTTRMSGDVEHTVHDAIVSKLAQLGEYQLAPFGESNEAAKTVIARRKLKGFYLAVSVDKLDYSEGGLRVRVKIAVFSYPGKDLRGEVPAAATITGVRPGDSGGEDQLIGLVATRAAELFAENFR